MQNVSGLNQGPNASNVVSLQSTMRDVGGVQTDIATLAAGTNSDFILPSFKPNIQDHFGLIGNVTTSTLGGILHSAGVPNNTDLFLVNLGAYALNIAHQDPGSTPGNQFICINGTYVILPPFGGVRCKYLVNLLNNVSYWVLS
jgi:hypothetical protein